MNNEDKNWLLTKCITTIIISLILLCFNVVTSVVLGGISAIAADSKVVGLIVTLTIYFSLLSGRKYLMERIGRRFFTKAEEDYMTANSIVRPYAD